MCIEMFVWNVVTEPLQKYLLPKIFPPLPDFLSSSGSGTGSTQPRQYN
jgi:hypothetical protein